MFSRTLRNLLILGVVALTAITPASAATDTIYIPRIKLFVPITEKLADGPVKYWWDEDTTAIAGHRTTFTRPFYDLDKLRRGDLIRTSGTNYYVRKIVVVRPSEVWILRWKGLVLSACTPKGSAKFRIVILAGR